MANRLRKAAAWLENKRHAFMTEPVTYVRGDLAVIVNATVGRTQFQSEDAAGVLLNSASRDFLIRAADLVMGSSVIEPEGGDRIVDADGYEYEVMPIDGERAWRWSDATYITRRIHTKLKAKP